jgi:transcriptional regulator GlxA family with amidase domain
VPRTVEFLIFPDFQLLDAAGPIAAFEIAAAFSQSAYRLRVSASRAGLVKSSSGAALLAQGFGRAAAIDTLIVAGGDGTRAAARDTKTLRFVRRGAERSRRVASVCSGTYILAAAGLLDGRSATTHWSRTQDFARRFPQVHLEADRIFVQSGKIWTSAGISAGIDLALALIAEDLGEGIAQRVARQLVVYYRRPGGQSQFSALLELERADGRFAALLDRVRGDLKHRLRVEELAQWAGMSPRHFAREFQVETGVTPAKAVERLRSDTARAMLESGARSLSEVATACGFRDTERMRRTFLRLFGTAPSALKRRRRAASE